MGFIEIIMIVLAAVLSIVGIPYLFSSEARQQFKRDAELESKRKKARKMARRRNSETEVSGPPWYAAYSRRKLKEKRKKKEFDRWFKNNFGV